MSERHVALITGASGGIGAAIARRLASAGVHVVAAGRRIERCRELAAALGAEGASTSAVALDVTHPASIREAIARARDEAPGGIDWLVNGAGAVQSAPLGRHEGEVDLYGWHLDVNFHGSRRVLEALLPDLVARGYGRVVQIASSASLVGYAYVSAYCAAKHAVLGYARAAALELAPKGVSVNVVCPWYVDSPMTDANVERIVQKTGRRAEDVRQWLAEQNPGRRLVAPREVADATWRLLAEERRTGVVLELDGAGERELEAGPEVGDRRAAGASPGKPA